MGPFRHQAVRDLAWLIASPPLMADGVPGLHLPDRAWLAALAAEAGPWLAALDDQPAELQRVIYDQWMGYERTPRIGHYAERLLAFWLERHPGVRLHAARRPVRRDGRDLGDLDVVFSQRDGPAVHWELSVKFYLRARPEPAWDAWVGPNPRDRLDLKLARVISHQLPLGAQPAASASAGLGDEPLTSQAFLKGWLFLPVGEDWQAGGPSPLGAAPDHGRGWWLRHGEDEPPQQARASRYLLPDRLEWMAPQHRPDDGALPPLAHRQLLARLDRSFQRHMSAVLVCEVQRDADGWWREVARGFVVHPRWPEIIEPSE